MKTFLVTSILIILTFLGSMLTGLLITLLPSIILIFLKSFWVSIPIFTFASNWDFIQIWLSIYCIRLIFNSITVKTSSDKKSE
jgi:hypothetical protein